MKFKLETNADVDCIRFENTDKKKYLCVLFKAEWCGHCKEFLPVFEQIIVKLHDYDISFLIIDENDKDEYNKFLKDREVRTLLLYACYLSCISSLLSLLFALRFNLVFGISDLLFTAFTDIVLGTLGLAYT